MKCNEKSYVEMKQTSLETYSGSGDVVFEKMQWLPSMRSKISQSFKKWMSPVNWLEKLGTDNQNFIGMLLREININIWWQLAYMMEEKHKED